MLTSGGIDDLCLKYFVEAGAMAVRRCKKEDLKRIARATGGKFILCKIIRYFLFLATLVSSLVNMEGEETFDASLLGKAGSVEQIRVCDDELILIKK